MAKVHFVMQGKGGVGKSLLCALMAQFMASKDRMPLCIDTDPLNATFKGYKALDVQSFDLLDDDQININPRKFDVLTAVIEAAENDIIVDNGASSFISLLHYLLVHDMPSVLKGMGKRMVLHTIITGGQAQQDTLNGFSQIADQFSGDMDMAVWLNPYWGEIENPGQSFEDRKLYQKYKDKIQALITLPVFQDALFGHDLSWLLRERLTFDEAIARADISTITRQRFKIMQNKFFEQMEAAVIL